MNCPACKGELPFRFVYASELKKYQCPLCEQGLVTTKASMSRIKLIMGTFSFVTSTPLGGFCCYLWFGTAQPLFALYFLTLGTAAIIGGVSLYSRKHIKFQESWHNL